MSKALARAKKKKALQFMRQGDFAAARPLCLELCRLDARDAEAWLMQGAVHGSLGAYEDAVRCCRKAAEMAPDYVDAWYNLAQANMHLLRRSEAVAAYREVLKRVPGHIEARNNLGLALEAMGLYDEAIRNYREVLAADPLHVGALNNLGNALQNVGAPEDGLANLRRAVQAAPTFYKARINFGFVLLKMGKLEAALEQFGAVPAGEPEYSDALLGRAAVFEKQGTFAAAYDIIRPLLEADFEDDRMAMVFASVARHVDRQADAVALLERVLARDDHAEVGMQQLHFQLGKLYDELKRYDEAFTHFAHANRLKPIIFSPEDYLRRMAALTEVFTEGFVRQAPRANNASMRPLFIVGMPRSGTTLVEQILSSHPRVHGGGEMSDMERIADSLPSLLGDARPYPQCLDRLTPDALDQSAARYLRALMEHSADADRVTDKMPHNFLHLGLIALLFPQARVVHCRRNPLDNCLSIFTYEFGAGHSYATDLTELGRHYRAYEALMAHWRRVLPIPIHEVVYEDMVANQEQRIRELIAFAGLDWDERCLRFHENKRVVNTISYDQVRRPMYSKSVERWRHYAAHLEPLRRALGLPVDLTTG